MVEVSHVTKRYGSHVAVDDLSFTIGRGQTYGFLGPNGAGKSTTMNIMTGCLAASEGEVRIGGYDIFEQACEAKRLIGYLPEQPPLYPDSTPREYLRFVGAAKGIPPRELSAAADAAMKLTDIGGMADRLVKNLSKGYRQRVGIAQAILGSPEIIILDEPTAGLDPKQIVEIRELIKELGKTHTVVLSSHILSEVQAVCGTILIISKGRLAACDTPENLERLFAGIYTTAYNIRGGLADFQYVLSAMAFVFLIIVPIATMRSIAEERRQKTDQLLYSLPLTAAEVVLGKYAAMLVLLLVPVGIICVYPLILSAYGKVYLPLAYGAMTGFFFLGAALLALIFLRMTRSSFVSGLLFVLIETGIFAFYIFDQSAFEGLFPGILKELSLFSRFESFVNGVFDVTALVFYVSAAGVFLFLTVLSMEKRRWAE